MQQAACGLISLDGMHQVLHEATAGLWAVVQDTTDRFMAYFTSEQDDPGDETGVIRFNYALFIGFLFFPVISQPARLRLRQQIADAGVFRVHLGELERSGEPNQYQKTVLVKELPQLPDLKQSEIDQLRERMNVMRLLSHPNLVRYITTRQQKGSLYLVQTQHEGCSLQTILESFGPMKEPTIRRYLLQILQALAYLHAHELPHGCATQVVLLVSCSLRCLCLVTDRNIHAATVTIDSCGLLKLSDFGIARFLRHVRNQAQERQDWYPVRGSSCLSFAGVSQ